ncbi:hypothetical protein QUF76_17935 [Desulfobacterales bacterium HSG16]|nr:hypothetical protein [Desulfobacterales bacterium HSG16]
MDEGKRKMIEARLREMIELSAETKDKEEQVKSGPGPRRRLHSRSGTTGKTIVIRRRKGEQDKLIAVNS